MALSLWLKASVLWFAILVLASLNGALREKILRHSLFAALCRHRRSRVLARMACSGIKERS
jgi:hypothetical protein